MWSSSRPPTRSRAVPLAVPVPHAVVVIEDPADVDAVVATFAALALERRTLGDAATPDLEAP